MMKRLIVGIVLLAFLIVSSVIFAGPQERKAMFASLKKGITFKAAGKRDSYIYLSEVRSVNALGSTPLADNGALQSNLAVTRVLETKGNYSFFTHAKIKRATLTRSGRVRTYPVAYNPRTNQFGIITGMIEVRLGNINNAAVVARNYGTTIRRCFANLDLCYFSVRTGRNIFTLTNNLNNDSRVKSAAIEVLENINIPH